MSRHLLLLIFSVMIFAGCEKRREPGIYTGEVNRPIKVLAANDVIVRVNGEKITKHDYQVRRRLIEKIHRTIKRIPLENKDKGVRSHMKSSEQGIPMELMRRVLMRQASDKARILASEQELAKAEKKFMKYLGKPEWKIADIDKRFGAEEGAILRKMLEDDVRFEKLRRQSTTNDYMVVSDEEVKAHQERIRKFDANANRLNAKAQNRATKFRQKVLAGADFAEETEKSAQLLKEYGKVWETLQLTEVEAGSPFRKWLEGARPGDISEPIDLDDGLAVIKCVSKKPAEVGAGMDPIDEYELVRCTFYAYQHAIPQTDEEIRVMLVKERRDAVQRQLGEKLMAEAVIEFPNGADFFGTGEATKATDGNQNLK